MAPLTKIIIDTDPGVDDVLAMLLAFSAKPEELEVLMISLTFGNIDIQNCLRNTVSLFHYIEKELAWRKQNGKPEGFEALRAHKPIVALGAEEPLEDQKMMADYFHGIDGLGGIHHSHPHLTPEDTWKTLFNSKFSSEEEAAAAAQLRESDAERLFLPSVRPAHEEMLRILKENEPDTVTIVAIGPLTNLAIAAAQDPETFLRVKEVVVMGGCIEASGNVKRPPPPLISLDAIDQDPAPPFRLIKQYPSRIRAALNERNQITPVAEFNVFADSVATARVYALTSPNPATTMPPAPPGPDGKAKSALKPYPEKLSRQLKLTIFPLDLTEPHHLTRGQFNDTVTSLVQNGSPLGEWANAFLTSTFKKIESLEEGASGPTVGLSLHDPLCIWYALTPLSPSWHLAPNSPEDIRVETSGQWTRGMCMVDRRPRRKREDDIAGEIPGDTGNWLSNNSGNRVRRMVASPGELKFGDYLLHRVFT